MTAALTATRAAANLRLFILLLPPASLGARTCRRRTFRMVGRTSACPQVVQWLVDDELDTIQSYRVSLQCWPVSLHHMDCVSRGRIMDNCSGQPVTLRRRPRSSAHGS